MGEAEQKIWDAISSTLRKVGDADLRAGLSWLEQDDAAKVQVVRAAIVAVGVQGWRPATLVKGEGGCGGAVVFKVDENYLSGLSVEQLRQEVRDFAGRWIELQNALRDLPELPSAELLHVLGDFARWPEDHERGKEISRRVGSDAVPPVTECEGGAGWWALVREALLHNKPKST